MAIDRVATLRNAEKLIRQGKLDAGIAEYVRLVDDAPGDWNAKNTLGDLYTRTGQTDKAIEQFIEIADHLSEEGALAKAAAVFKKVLKLKPDHEHSLVQLADALAMQRLYADARAQLTTLMQLRESRGDVRGVLQARIQIGSIDPDDYEGRRSAARARIEMGDVGGAMRDLKEIAGELVDKGRQTEAVDVLREAAALNPDDEEIREKLFDVFVGAGDYASARGCAHAVDQFRMIAALQESQGQVGDALETLRAAAAHDPLDLELRADLVRKLAARGDTAAAAEFLTRETAGADPGLLMMLADLKLHGGAVDEGVAIIRQLLDQDPARREKIASLGWTLAEQKPDAGFRIVELAAEAAVAQSDWPAAAAALQEYVTRVPTHIPALMRLVEICVDGGLEATMYSAQAQLADAYLEAGSATEARFIAEDLVAREPWEKSNIERFRRALVILGESDPDGVIAERLSGESPFMSTDLSLGLDDLAPEVQPAEAVMDRSDVDLEVLTLDEGSHAAAGGRRRTEDSSQFQLSANAIPLDDILGDLDTESFEPQAEAVADGEIELSFDDIKQGAAPAPEPAVGLETAIGVTPGEDARRRGSDNAEKEYRQALKLRQKGDIDGCIAALENASRSPKLRFSTAWMIARLYRDRGQLPQALEWLERASNAEAPNDEDARQVLYELGEALEKEGESVRALAVFLELQADAPDYRDVAVCIDRLTKVQARG